MILESCQLLSTAHRVLDGIPFDGKTKTGRKVKRWKLPDPYLDETLYQATHINHPSSVWCRTSKDNYIWLCNLTIALCEEYQYRYQKIHKIERDGLCFVLLKNVPQNISLTAFSEPTPAMPDDCKVTNNSILSYQSYYIQKKMHIATWKKRSIPVWYETNKFT